MIPATGIPDAASGPASAPACNRVGGAANRRLAILAQFDPEGGVPAHVRLHLEGLRPAVSRLVLVSNSPIAPDALAGVEDLCDRILIRSNKGWDFAGWRDALATEEPERYDRVILTNSSVIGPLYPLAPIFEEMEAQAPDIWGMVLSLNQGMHLQSYFISASATVVASAPWQDFWNSVQDFTDKRQVIRSYEIGFSRAMLAAGFDIAAMNNLLPFPRNIRIVNIQRLKGWVKVPFSANRINRTVDFHEELIRGGMPYLKASLLFGKDTYRFVGLDRIRCIPGVDFPFESLTG